MDPGVNERRDGSLGGGTDSWTEKGKPQMGERANRRASGQVWGRAFTQQAP